MDRRLEPTKQKMSPHPETDELNALFASYSVNGVAGPSHFHRFLVHVQHEHNISESQSKILMEIFMQDPFKQGLRRSDFIDYMFSTQHNHAVDSRVHHDMSAPLAHYYIFTGHNSYLTGNQLGSACSEKPIVDALRRGVRVVELDLWPNSEKDDILVYHGRTLTSPVDFKTCLVAIKANAFVKTSYPVIVTLEDHLPPHLQAKAAKVLIETFGSTIFYPENTEGMKEFPSPEYLRGRILISTKPPKEFLGSESGEASKGVEQRPEKNSIWGREHFFGRHHGKDLGDSTEIDSELSSDEEKSKAPEQRKAEHVSSEYMKLITIKAGKPKGKLLVDALQIADFVKRVSVSEPQLAKVVQKNPEAVVRFTQKNLLRIYPRGLRVDSSNYNPFLAWAHGAQLVAANMQGYGRHLWAAQGFFKANGGCGYVKKPEFLLSEGGARIVNMYYSTASPLPVKRRLKVKICTGCGWLEQFGKRSFDKFSAPDFYTRVGISGIEADTVMEKTSTIKNNWVPVWGEEFQFDLRIPEIALLRVEVHESDHTARDDFGGQTCLPVAELKPGYRVVPLCDEKGDELRLVKLLLWIGFSS